MPANTHFCFSTFASMSDLLLAVNNLNQECHLLEVGQLHAGQPTLLYTGRNAPSRMISALDFYTTQNFPDVLLKAYFKQQSTPVRGALLILESSQLSDIFSAAHLLTLKTDFEIIEINRSPRPNAQSSALFANGYATDFSFLSDKLTLQLIPEPNQHLLSLFNVAAPALK